MHRLSGCRAPVCFWHTIYYIILFSIQPGSSEYSFSLPCFYSTVSFFLFIRLALIQGWLCTPYSKSSWRDFPPHPQTYTFGSWLPACDSKSPWWTFLEEDHPGEELCWDWRWTNNLLLVDRHAFKYRTSKVQFISFLL